MPDLDGGTDSFVVECQGPAGLFGVFEDDGETGYLYLYQPDGAGILEHHWVYNRSSEKEATESNTTVNWDQAEQQFAVLISGIPRGAIRARGLEHVNAEGPKAQDIPA